jgi:hypothetical protein
MLINGELSIRQFYSQSEALFGTAFAFPKTFLVVVAANNVALNHSKAYYQALVARAPLSQTELN